MSLKTVKLTSQQLNLLREAMAAQMNELLIRSRNNDPDAKKELGWYQEIWKALSQAEVEG